MCSCFAVNGSGLRRFKTQGGLIFRLGKLLRAKGRGIVLLIPTVDRMVRVDLRVIPINVPYQEMMTRGNVPVRVDAVVYFRVIDPEAAGEPLTS